MQKKQSISDRIKKLLLKRVLGYRVKVKLNKKI